MADLFDMKVGGLGFHMTAHLLALVALFVACFAITGYISFRDDTVPGSALKDHNANFEAITADSLAAEDSVSIGSMVMERVYEIDLEGVTPAATEHSVLATVTTLPTNGQIINAALVVTELGSNAALALNLSTGAAGIAIGTDAAGNDDILGAGGIEAGTTGGVLGDTIYLDTAVDYGTTNTTLYLVNDDALNTATALTSGKCKVYVKYFGRL